MIDFKKIKESHLPDGIQKLTDGGIMVDMDIITSIMPHFNRVDIEYKDGTKIIWWPVIKQDDQL